MLSTCLSVFTREMKNSDINLVLEVENQLRVLLSWHFSEYLFMKLVGGTPFKRYMMVSVFISHLVEISVGWTV